MALPPRTTGKGPAKFGNGPRPNGGTHGNGTHGTTTGIEHVPHVYGKLPPTDRAFLRRMGVLENAEFQDLVKKNFEPVKTFPIRFGDTTFVSLLLQPMEGHPLLHNVATTTTISLIISNPERSTSVLALKGAMTKEDLAELMQQQGEIHMELDQLRKLDPTYPATLYISPTPVAVGMAAYVMQGKSKELGGKIAAAHSALPKDQRQELYAVPEASPDMLRLFPLNQRQLIEESPALSETLAKLIAGIRANGIKLKPVAVVKLEADQDTPEGIYAVYMNEKMKMYTIAGAFIEAGKHDVSYIQIREPFLTPEQLHTLGKGTVQLSGQLTELGRVSAWYPKEPSHGLNTTASEAAAGLLQQIQQAEFMLREIKSGRVYLRNLTIDKETDKDWQDISYWQNNIGSEPRLSAHNRAYRVQQYQRDPKERTYRIIIFIEGSRELDQVRTFQWLLHERPTNEEASTIAFLSASLYKTHGERGPIMLDHTLQGNYSNDALIKALRKETLRPVTSRESAIKLAEGPDAELGNKTPAHTPRMTAANHSLHLG